MSGGGKNREAEAQETPADLRRRAGRVRTLMRDMGNDQEALQRLNDLARDLELRASRLEAALRSVAKGASDA